MKTVDELTAADVATALVEIMRQESARVGHRHGGTQGVGEVPYDTGALQNSIYLSKTTKNTATITIGNEIVDYAESLEFDGLQENGKPNLHQGWLERVIERYLPEYLKTTYGVDVEIER